MTNIKDIDPVDFAAGVAHVAAGQLFEFLSMTENAGGVQAVNWFGGASSNAEDLQRDVSELARYAGRMDAGGEQLWRWGNIQGLVTENIPDSGNFCEVSLAHRLAFDMFATVSKIAHRQIDKVQIELRKAEAERAAAEAKPEGLKLEDSIFEPTGSLGDMEPHQAQFLKDQPAVEAQIAAAREAEDLARQQQEEENQALSAGSIEPPEPEKPETISIGQQGDEANAEGDAEQGQDAGGEDAPDPAAQGDVSELSDDEPAETDPARQGDDDGGAAGGKAPELAAPVEHAPGGDGAPADGVAVKPAKRSKSKSPKRN